MLRLASVLLALVSVTQILVSLARLFSLRPWAIGFFISGLLAGCAAWGAWNSKAWARWVSYASLAVAAAATAIGSYGQSWAWLAWWWWAGSYLWPELALHAAMIRRPLAEVPRA
ncbi:MAG: hypothetical protein V4510_09355 [bacterium]